MNFPSLPGGHHCDSSFFPACVRVSVGGGLGPEGTAGPVEWICTSQCPSQLPGSIRSLVLYNRLVDFP